MVEKRKQGRRFPVTVLASLFPLVLAMTACLSPQGGPPSILGLLKYVREPKNLLNPQEGKEWSKPFDAKAYGGPADHTLAFALCNVDDIWLAQVNPRLDPVHVDMGIAGMMNIGPFLESHQYAVFYAPPIRVGSVMRPTSFHFRDENRYQSTFYSTELGLNSGDEFGFAAAKPGLLYLGDYDMAFGAGDSLRLMKLKDQPHELKCLKELVKRFRGTAWEPVIRARMEELAK